MAATAEAAAAARDATRLEPLVCFHFILKSFPFYTNVSFMSTYRVETTMAAAGAGTFFYFVFFIYTNVF
jgi:hypothetical protein